MRRCVTRNLAKIAASAMCLTASTALWAQDVDVVEPSVEITPFIAYRGGGGFRDGTTNQDLNLSSKAGFGFALNWAATEPGTQYELLYSRQHTDTGGSAPIDITIQYLQIGGTAVIGDASSHVIPFAAGGLGAARFSPDPSSLSTETRFAFNLGGGVHIPLANHVRLRLEARGYLTWLNGNSDLFCSSSSSTAGCVLQARGQTFFQYEALGGVSIGF